MELGFGVVRMAQLIAPFPDRLFGGEEAVHGAFRTLYAVSTYGTDLVLV